MKGKIKTISYQEAKEFLLPRHYSGRMPSVSYAFGWYIDGDIVAVCTFGKPASNSLCVGICGKEWSPNVYELNRLCRIDELEENISQFVSACLRRLKSEDLIVVSYADSSMGHHGYVYQASNFLYTGETKRRTDKWTPGGKHSRHYSNDEQGKFRKVRSAKHRYVYFCTKNRYMKKKWKELLSYEIQDYPKGENEMYQLGEYKKDEIVEVGK